MADHLLLALVLVAGSLLVAVVALLVVHRFLSAGGAAAPTVDADHDDALVLLFDDDTLCDATPRAWRFFGEAAEPPGNDWDRLVRCLEGRFPDLAAQAEALEPHETLTLLAGRGGAAQEGVPALRLERLAGKLRLTLLGAPGVGEADALTLWTQEEELQRLRDVAAEAPILIWRRDADGTVTWANRAYLDLVAADAGSSDAALPWPLPELFEAPQDGTRRPLGSGTGAARWFDIVSRPQPDGGMLVFASPADQVVQAEHALREFRQTLTRSFAQMPFGIAVFDRQRLLQMFNPALVDMTGVDPAFLSGRPSLAAVLDRLRDDRILPEPRDYKEWRNRLTQLEEAAEAGDFEEIWNVPTGHTFSVTGQPHPDGGIALLLEDISSEVTVTRRLRAELQTLQALIDSLDEAIAVFAASGELVASNAAYARLWGVDPGMRLAEVGLREALAHWQGQSGPSRFWSLLRDGVPAVTAGDAVRCGSVRLRDGRRLDCRAAPLAGGRMLVGFRPATAAPPDRADGGVADAAGARATPAAAGRDMGG